jgi:hypothetical protein
MSVGFGADSRIARGKKVAPSYYPHSPYSPPLCLYGSSGR